MLPALVMGCSMNEEQFEDARIDARCAWSVECYPGVYSSLDECTADWGDGTPSGLACTYDAAAAADCVAGLQEMECPTDGAAPSYPEACAVVYTECTGADQ